MTPERWAQIEDLFHRAVECDPRLRTALLDHACGTDLQLRQQVETLLSKDEAAHSGMQALVRAELDSVTFSLTGETVSHYRILSGLGGGGMGLVYRAEDIKLPRQVAIKLLREDSAKDAVALGRFEREAHAASALEDPYICPIYEFGEHNGQPFIVMPLLEGQTMEELIRKQGSPTDRRKLQELLEIAIQVATGLESAHSHGIVHRDIKPSNIFMTITGQAKILDFGIAKLIHGSQGIEEPRSIEATEASGTLNVGGLTLSRTEAVIGTAAYMSPEQVRGENVDARTDIFSFGLLLYELATGKRAFEGNTWPALKDAVLTGMPKPVREINPIILPKLQRIIDKAIEKEPDLRFQTAAEIRAELESVHRELAPSHLSRPWAIGLAAAGAVIAGVLVWSLNKPSKTISVTPEIALHQLTTNSSENPVIGGSISPDGKYLAYSDSKALHIKIMDSGEIRTLPQPEEFKKQEVRWEFGAWFPDSTKFLLNAQPATEFSNQSSSDDTSIWTATVLGEVPVKLRDHAVVWSVSPDGSTVSFGTNKGKRGEREVWLMGPNGEQGRKFYEVGDDAAICCLGWSPDGKRYEYILTNSSGDNILTRDLNWGPPITLFNSTELNAMGGDIVWLHGGRVVYSQREKENANVCNYWTMRLDLDTGKRIDEPRRVTNWPKFCVDNGSATRDDRKITFTASSSFYTSYIADLHAGGTHITNLKHFTLEDADDVITDWTPDSKGVIVAQNRNDGYSLYKQRLDSDTSDAIVSSMAGLADFATPTPDSKWILALIWPVSGGKVVERPKVPLPIVRIPLGGGTPETVLQLLRPSPISCTRPPSNMCVIIEQTDDKKQMIVSDFDAITGRGSERGSFDLARDIDTFVDNLICAISPDGRRLAIARSPESPIEIYSIRGQLIQRIPTAPLGKLIGLVWSPDEKGVFLIRKADNGTELLHLDLRGHLQSLRKCAGGWACFGSPSPDGRHLAIVENNQSRNMWMMENF